MQIFISFVTGVVLFYAFQYFPFLTVALILLCSFILALKKKLPIILFLLSGTAFAFLRYEPINDIPFIRDTISLHGVFQSYPTKTERGMFKQSLRIDSAVNIKTDEKLDVLAGQKITLLSDRAFFPGTNCDATAMFLKNTTRLNPGARKHNRQFAILLDLSTLTKGKTTVSSIIQNYRYRLDRFIDANFKKDSGAFLKAITLGQKAEIDYELRNAFNTTGLVHILSISGTHFGLFSLFLFLIFSLLIKAFPYRILLRITIFFSPSQVAAGLCLPFMLAYLCLSGASIPAIRSFIMIGLFMVGLTIGRKGFWLTSLLCAAFVLTLWDPEVLFSLSFQLSFIAVLFIGLSIAHIRHERKGDKKFFRYVKNVLVITTAAYIGTAPLVAYHFHFLSIISPIANMLIAPLVGFILIPLSVVSAFLFLITGHFMLTPIVSALLDLIISLVKLFADVPFSDIKISSFPPIIAIIFYVGVLSFFLSTYQLHKIFSLKWTDMLKKHRLRIYILIIPLIPVALYLFLSVFQGNEFKITYLDVGQGDSSVIELPDGKTMVIDTGKTGREASAFLAYRGKTVIDALILSHIHPDHTGGLHYLTKRFKVRELWTHERLILLEPFANLKQRMLSRGDLVEGRGYRMYVFHPYPEFYTLYGNEYIAENNDSLVLKFIVHHKSFLFTGDIEEEAEEDIVHLGNWLKSDVMKVPHHGGKTSAHEPFLEAVSPDVAVISTERNNPFGHPHEEILDALYVARIFRTDTHGAIKIEESAKGLHIKKYRDFQFEKAKSLKEEAKNIKRLFETW